MHISWEMALLFMRIRHGLPVLIPVSVGSAGGDLSPIGFGLGHGRGGPFGNQSAFHLCQGCHEGKEKLAYGRLSVELFRDAMQPLIGLVELFRHVQGVAGGTEGPVQFVDDQGVSLSI